MNLQEQLEKEAVIKREEDFSGLKALESTKQLLLEAGTADYQILRDMGMHRSIQRNIDLKGRKMELEKLEEQYGQIFTVDEIKNLACKYALKFLRSDEYSGEVDVEMLAKIKEFSKESGIDMNGAKLQYNFFILAPQAAFVLKNKPDPIPRDPILFYRIDENHFRLIHKWGNDLSNWRRLIGWKYTNELTYIAYWFTITFLPLFFICMCIQPSLWLAIPAFVVATVFSVVRVNRDGKGKFEKWSETWINNEKQSA
jgi:hypothetical protein